MFSCCLSRKVDYDHQRKVDDRCLDWRDELSVGKEVCVWMKPMKSSDGFSRWEKGNVSSIIDSKGEVLVTVKTSSGYKWTGPIDASELLPNMTERGITVRHLKCFAEKCREKIIQENILDPREYLDRDKTLPNPDYNKGLDFESIPTYLVVDLFVKPKSKYRLGSSEETRKRRVPFVDLLADIFPDIGGPRKATHFATHSWSSFFVDLLAAFEHLPDDAAIWICSFAMTQDDERLELVDEAEVFAEPLKSKETEHILVCDTRMESLKRMWALFEILRSVQFGKTLQLRPLKVILNVADAMNENRCAIEMSKCGCSREHDKKYITREMEKIGGLKKLNKMVRKGMVWAFNHGIDETNNGDLEGIARIRALLGMTYADQAQFQDAAKELHDAIDLTEKLNKRCRPHNIGQDEITNWKMRRGQALSLGGDDAEAVKVMRDAIAEEEKWMDQRICRNALNLSEVLRRTSHFSEAEEELKKAQKHCLSDPHQLADLHLKLGQLLSHFKWQNSKATEEFRRALKSQTGNLLNYAKDSQKIAKTKYNLAMSLRRQHLIGDAEDMYREAYKVQVNGGLNKKHLDILNSRMNIGITLGHQGNLEDARKELEEVVRLHKSKGCDHPKLAIALVSLGDVMRYQGQHYDAVKHYNEALSIYRGQGEDYQHKNELAWANTSLAFAHMYLKEQEGEAKGKGHCNHKTIMHKSLQEALEYNREIFGEHHISVALLLGHIGTSLRIQGDFRGAKRKYTEALDIFKIDSRTYPEGMPWIIKQIELCNLKSRIILPTPVEVLARLKIGRCNHLINNWKECFDKFCTDQEDMSPEVSDSKNIFETLHNICI